MIGNSVQSDCTTYDFEEEGVRIKIRAQKNFVRVIKHGTINRDDYNPVDGIFPKEVVIHFEIVGENNQPVADFQPPFELAVRYSARDLDRAKGKGAPLTLCYFDDMKQKWIPFTEDKHQFRLIPDHLDLNSLKSEGKLVETGGYGVAYIWDWNDPAVGWHP